MFSLGVRIPYNRWSNAALTFLRQLTEPYLRIFRRFLPSFGGLDFSPILGIIVVRLVGSLLARASAARERARSGPALRGARSASSCSSTS